MRKTAEVTITAEGRDKGKVFVITEMPAAQAEKWACRALLLAAQSGADVGDTTRGMLGIAVMGVQAIIGGVRFADVEPLLDEMFRCVQVRPNPRDHDPARALITRALIDDDTEEIETRVQLRGEVLELHLGFSLADALSRLKYRGTSAGSQSTQTSFLPSEQ